MENEEKSQAEQENKSQSVWKDLWDYAKIILVVFVIAFLLGHFVYINARVPSGSMEQTIMTGDRVFGNRLAYKTKDPERFDIVIFKYPDDPSQLFVKRVIGLPGETVNIVDGKVYINDSEEPLDDSFCPETPEGSFGPYNKIKGIPTTKYQCFVLWRNKYIPAHVPILPPSRLTMNNVRSGIRKRCLIARLLSEYITYNPTMFISSR